MNASQSFRIYEILQKHFQNSEDAKAVVAEIEQVIENKINDKKDVLASKEDIKNLEVLVERRFNSIIMWLVGTGIGIVGLLVTFLKVL